MIYTDIIRIERPSTAAPDSVVTIDVFAENQYSQALYLSTVVSVNDTQVTISPDYIAAAPGRTYRFTGSFVMPSVDAVIEAHSLFYGDDGVWHYEGYQTRTINVPETLLQDGGITIDSIIEPLILIMVMGMMMRAMLKTVKEG